MAEAINPQKILPWWPLIEREALSRGLDPYVVGGIMWVESRGNPNATNDFKATGLMQVVARENPNPLFSRRPSEKELLDPATNVRWGCIDLKDKLNAARGNLERGMYYYSGGDAWEKKHGAKGYEKYLSMYWRPLQQHAANLKAAREKDSNVIDARCPWVTLDRQYVKEGQPYWKLVGFRYQDEKESGGLHHIFLEGPRQGEWRVSNDVEAWMPKLDKPEGEPASNFDMYKDNTYNARMLGAPSEVVRGLKMRGPDADSEHAPHHVAYYLRFELVGADPGVPTPTETLEEQLLRERDGLVLIRLNPEAALQKAMLAQGYVPNTNEHETKRGRTTYIWQGAERLSDGAVSVFYCEKGKWSDVRVAAREGGGGGSQGVTLDLVAYVQLGQGANLVLGDCGPASIKIVGQLSNPVDEIALACGQFKGDTGATRDELIRGAKKFGVTLTKANNVGWGGVERELRAGRGVIVLVHYPDLPVRYDAKYQAGHYVVIVGLTATDVIYHDPYWPTRDQADYIRTNRSVFGRAWQRASLDGNQSYSALFRR